MHTGVDVTGKYDLEEGMAAGAGVVLMEGDNRAKGNLLGKDALGEGGRQLLTGAPKSEESILCNKELIRIIKVKETKGYLSCAIQGARQARLEGDWLVEA